MLTSQDGVAMHPIAWSLLQSLHPNWSHSPSLDYTLEPTLSPEYRPPAIIKLQEQSGIHLALSRFNDVLRYRTFSNTDWIWPSPQQILITTLSVFFFLSLDTVIYRTSLLNCAIAAGTSLNRVGISALNRPASRAST